MRAMTTPPFSLDRAAEITGGRVHGDGSIEVARIAPVADAGPDDMGFLADRRYLDDAEASRARALLVSTDLVDRLDTSRSMVVVDDGHVALQALLAHLHPPLAPVPGVHPTAVLERGVRLGSEVEIGPYVVLGAGVVVGDRTRIGAHSVLGAGAAVGSDSVLHPHVVLYAGTHVGDRVILHAGVRLGVDGFGYAWSAEGHLKVPQVGRCLIEDDVEIGANSTVDRGSIGDTRVGLGTKLDNLVHLAHNVQTGAHCAAAALVGIAGSTQVGSGVFFGGQAGAIGHLKLGDGARIAAAAAVYRDVPAGETVSGVPARPNREFLRARASLERLPKLVARVRELEDRLAALEEAGPQLRGP